MDERESVYLDLVRFSASVAVVFNHLLHNNALPASWANSFPDFGREAVIAFFVLSGYVIAYTTAMREPNLKSYFIARAARLYSVALPVLLLAFVIDSFALQFHSENYHHLYQYEKFYLYIPLHLGFLGEVWFLSERPFTIPPYWSLSFEAWYYVLFATLFFYRGRRRWLLTLVVAAIVGYQHWLLFPIWLSGVALFKYRDRVRLSIALARVGFALSLLAFVALELSGWDVRLWRLGRELWPFPQLPQGSTDQFLLDYVVCVIVVTNFYCARHAALNAILLISAPIRLLAGFTFTLYLVHTLVMFTWLRNFSFDRENLLHLAALLIVISLCTGMIGNVTERKKRFYQRLLTRVVEFLHTNVARWPWLLNALRPNAENPSLKLN